MDGRRRSNHNLMPPKVTVPFILDSVISGLSFPSTCPAAPTTPSRTTGTPPSAAECFRAKPSTPPTLRTFPTPTSPPKKICFFPVFNSKPPTQSSWICPLCSFWALRETAWFCRRRNCRKMGKCRRKMGKCRPSRIPRSRW